MTSICLRLSGPRSSVSTGAAVRLWTLVAFSLLATSSGLMAAVPSLTHLSPPGGQRGSTVTVTCKGKFDWPASIHAPGVTVTPGKESGQMEVVIPADLAADRIWVRLFNAEGASAAVPFLIGSLPDVAEKEPNNAPSNAQKLEAPAVTVNGVLEGADVDGFLVSVKAGQTLVAGLEANTRLGSPMDAILQVATPAGFVVAENHDTVGLDPRIRFTPEKDGDYVVRVFAFPSDPNSSIAYHGGANYIYRLTITTGPFITHTVPMSVSAAEPGEVEVHGYNIPAGTKMPVHALSKVAGQEEFEAVEPIRLAGDVRQGVVFAPGYGGQARVRLTPYASVAHLSDGQESSPFKLPFPVTLTGRIGKARQTDTFLLPLEKGTPLVITSEARGLGFPIDAVVQLNLLDGKQAARLDEVAPKVANIMAHTTAQAGDYQLTVRDRYRTGGPESFYQLTIRKETPDFELSPASDAIVIPHDKPAELVVNVKRRGGTVGPVTIEAVDLPAGVKAAAVVSEPKGDSAAKVTLSFTSEGTAFSGPIRIVGTCKEPQEIKRSALTAPKLGACFDSVWATVIAKPAPPAEPEKAEKAEPAPTP